MKVEVHERLSDIAEDEWNRLNRHDYPFLRHEFLAAAEHSGCVSPASGWQPRHLALRDAGGTLRAAMPLYEKNHSWGEFVFDWAWARAYEQAGLDYYPKLVSAVPFTPASSQRLLCDPDSAEDYATPLIECALQLARDESYSSFHVQFPLTAELRVLQQAGMKLRKDCQFHWHNAGYGNFDDFLAQFSSRKRKKARRDRRRVSEQGIRFRHLHGHEMSSELWQEVYELISMTFLRRGSMPYFSLEFFETLSARMPAHVLVIVAEVADKPVAAAVFFVGRDRLYGRYWGSNGYYDALHFETCYYQGIEYCIEHGLQAFEPGTQGEHKISRGFTAVTTWSAHWLAHDRFFAAVGQYLDEELQYVDRYIDAVDAHSPFRRSRSK